MQDLSFRNEFHGALDAVAPPAPWLAASVRDELWRRRHEAYPSRRQAWLSPVLPRVSMRLATAALIVALAVAAAGAFIAINNYIHGPIPTRPHGGAITRMCNQQGSAPFTITGWPGSPTSTGWQNSPPNVPGWVKGGESTCVLDSNHAWVTEATGISSCPGTPPCAGPQVQHVIVLSTRDGGQTWQRSQPIPAAGANLAVEVDFLDDQYGWLLTDTGYYATPQFVRTLFATTDGGLHWSRVSNVSPGAGSGLARMAVGCAESGIVFVNAVNGWLAWNCSASNGPAPAQTAGPVVAATIDGGRTWSPVFLPSYPTGTDWSCGSTPPIFTGNQGVLQLSCGGIGHPGWDAVYMSADNGATWTVGQFPVPFFGPVDFLDANTAFFVSTNGADDSAGSDLYRTVDGGRDWTLVKKGLFPGQSIDDFQFIDATAGFANTSNSPATWKTIDGGKTWVLPAPYRSVGTMVCALPPDPGPPIPFKFVNATTYWTVDGRRTADGGADWSGSGPPSAVDRSPGTGQFFLDATNAWVAEAAGSSGVCTDHVAIFGTVDGGQDWQQLGGIDAPSTQAWNPELDFVDAQHGWLFVAGGSLTVYGHLTTGPLYSTSDGGRHWTLVLAQVVASTRNCVALPTFSFSSTTTGRMQVQCGFGGATSLSWLVTGDGGATWTMQTLVRKPISYTPLPLPTFFDERHGWVYDSINYLLFATSNGGGAWSRRGLPTLLYFTCQGKFGPTQCSNEGIAAVTFSSPSQGWAILDRSTASGTQFSVQHTANGGRTWRVVSGPLPRVAYSTDPGEVRLIFVDTKVGFWSAGPSVLLVTTDGGRTWKSATTASK